MVNAEMFRATDSNLPSKREEDFRVVWNEIGNAENHVKLEIRHEIGRDYSLID